MKNALIVTCALLFVSVAGFADGPAPGPVSDEVLSAILGEPLEGDSCATKAGGTSEMRFVTAVQGQKAVCTVNCPSGTPVSCTSPTTCTAVERNCEGALEPGHVTCGTTTLTCTPSCCSSGTIRDRACCRCAATGACFDCCRCEGGTGVQCSLACGS